jgi:hypothetical protein
MNGRVAYSTKVVNQSLFKGLNWAGCTFSKLLKSPVQGFRLELRKVRALKSMQASSGSDCSKTEYFLVGNNGRVFPEPTHQSQSVYYVLQEGGLS